MRSFTIFGLQFLPKMRKILVPIFCFFSLLQTNSFSQGITIPQGSDLDTSLVSSKKSSKKIIELCFGINYSRNLSYYSSRVDKIPPQINYSGILNFKLITSKIFILNLGATIDQMRFGESYQAWGGKIEQFYDFNFIGGRISPQIACYRNKKINVGIGINIKPAITLSSRYTRYIAGVKDWETTLSFSKFSLYTGINGGINYFLSKRLGMVFEVNYDTPIRSLDYCYNSTLYGPNHCLEDVVSFTSLISYIGITYKL